MVKYQPGSGAETAERKLKRASLELPIFNESQGAGPLLRLLFAKGLLSPLSLHPFSSLLWYLTFKKQMGNDISSSAGAARPAAALQREGWGCSLHGEREAQGRTSGEKGGVREKPLPSQRHAQLTSVLNADRKYFK